MYSLRSRFVLLPLAAWSTVLCAAGDLSALPMEQLIESLAYLDAQAPGMLEMASVTGFIAEDRPPRFAGGVLGGPAPRIAPEMRELARRGVAALPLLLAHLGDKRPTKLTVGLGFFMFRCFHEEYDPRVRPKQRFLFGDGAFERNFDCGYRVKIGDVCYAIIGQIVNRNLSPVRYQPTLGLVINSPIEARSLVERARKDWGALDRAGHQASLVTDARSDDLSRTSDPALVRLRFYYPEAYAGSKTGDLHDRIAAFEARDKDLP